MANNAMKQMPLTEHLGELRKRLIIGFSFFLISVILGFVVSFPVIEWMNQRLTERGLVYHAFAFGDALGVYVKIALLIGFVISLPFLLYQVWAFVRPGLRKEEQQAALRFIPFATILFLLGLSFAYFILFPMILEFMLKMTASIGAEMLLGINQYFSFLFAIIVPVAIFFELPILVMFFTRIRILNPLRLKKMRKYAYFLLVIVAAMITPPEMITQIMVAIPLILLYEFSVWLSSIIYRKQLAEDAAAESRY